MVDGGIGISAAISIGSKFIERSKFTARHDAVYDKEAEKRVKLAERFEKIPKEDVDYFELEEYNALHARSSYDLRSYKATQDEYKSKDWHKRPVEKYRTRGRVRQAKRHLQSSIAIEGSHIEDLEMHSRSSSVSSYCSSTTGSFYGGSESGLDLERCRPYRTDSCSLRATGGSPPSTSLDDITNDEHKQGVATQISDWLSTTEAANPSSPYHLHADAGEATVPDAESDRRVNWRNHSPSAASLRPSSLARRNPLRTATWSRSIQMEPSGEDESSEEEASSEGEASSTLPMPILAWNLMKRLRERRVPTLSSPEDLRKSASGAGKIPCDMFRCPRAGCSSAFSTSDRLLMHIRAHSGYVQEGVQEDVLVFSSMSSSSLTEERLRHSDTDLLD